MTEVYNDWESLFERFCIMTVDGGLSDFSAINYLSDKAPKELIEQTQARADELTAQINAIQYECMHCHGYVTRPLNKEEREDLRDEGRLKSIYRNLT